MPKLAQSCSAIAALVLTLPAYAELHDRGNGLLYDDVLNVTWLQNANLAETERFGVQRIGPDGRMWYPYALEWIAAMNENQYLGYSNWRLPKMDPINGVAYNLLRRSDAGDTDNGYNATAPGTLYAGSTNHELAYMYFNNLGLKSIENPDGSYNPNFGIFGNGTGDGVTAAKWTRNDVGLVKNLMAWSYWAEANFPPPNDFLAGSFGMVLGGSGPAAQSNLTYAWALRDGDVVASVPEPESALLMLSGLGVIGALAKRRTARA